MVFFSVRGIRTNVMPAIDRDDLCIAIRLNEGCFTPSTSGRRKSATRKKITEFRVFCVLFLSAVTLAPADSSLTQVALRDEYCCKATWSLTDSDALRIRCEKTNYSCRVADRDAVVGE